MFHNDIFYCIIFVTNIWYRYFILYFFFWIWLWFFKLNHIWYYNVISYYWKKFNSCQQLLIIIEDQNNFHSKKFSLISFEKKIPAKFKNVKKFILFWNINCKHKLHYNKNYFHHIVTYISSQQKHKLIN